MSKLGKFEDEQVLLDSYRQLEKAYTRSRQYIGQLKRILTEQNISVPCEKKCEPLGETDCMSAKDEVNECADRICDRAVDGAEGVSAVKDETSSITNGISYDRAVDGAEGVSAVKDEVNEFADRICDRGQAQEVLDRECVDHVIKSLDRVFEEGTNASVTVAPPNAEDFYQKFPFARTLLCEIEVAHSDPVNFGKSREEIFLSMLNQQDALYRLLGEGGIDYLLSRQDVCDRIITDYIERTRICATPLITHGRAVSCPPNKPTTLRQAKSLIGHYIK